MTNLLAGPVIAMVTEASVGKAPSVKFNTPVVASMGAVIARPLKAATPATAAFVLLTNVPPAPVKAAVTVDVSDVTTLPPESTTSTTGCGVRATPLTAPAAGAVAKA